MSHTPSCRQPATLLFVAAMALGCNPASDHATGHEDGVHFRVDMRDAIGQGWFDPTIETVGVRGDLSPLSWGQTIEAADPDGDRVYEVFIPFESAAEGVIVYKFKVDGSENPNDGWENGRNRVVDRSTSSVVSRVFDDPPEPLPSTFTGNVEVHHAFESGDLRSRDLYVYLPPDYADSGERYPVLYMHDGRNVFDAAETGVEWGMDELAEQLIAASEIKPIIIVGVGNTPDRIYEYTPTPAAVMDQREVGGGGDAYGRVIVERIKPFIDKTYRTKPDRANTSIGGSSLGGLISLYLGLTYADVFGQLLVVSPSAWWDEGFIVREVEALDGPTNQRIWLDIGGREGDDVVESVRALHASLSQRGWSVGDLRFVVDEGADHSERAWASRSADMLRFLYRADMQ